MREVLVTGGAGFIGVHLARALARVPDTRVLVVDNLQRGQLDANLRALLSLPNVALVQADLTEPDAFDVDIPPRPFDEVYHLAAVNGTSAFYADPLGTLRTNTLSLINLIDWLAQLERKPSLLFTSSNEAYAGLEALGKLPLPTPEGVPLVVADPYNPRWSYGASKLVGELLVINAARQLCVQAVIVRPHNFYGPRAGSGHVIPELISRILAREDPFKVSGYDQSRSFCYVDDAIDAMIRCMAQASVHPPTIHIGSSEETPIPELARRLFAIADWTPHEIEMAPAPAGSVRRRLPDVRRARDLTGWEASTSLDVGLRATFEWYAARARSPGT